MFKIFTKHFQSHNVGTFRWSEFSLLWWMIWKWRTTEFLGCWSSSRKDRHSSYADLSFPLVLIETSHQAWKISRENILTTNFSCVTSLIFSLTYWILSQLGTQGHTFKSKRETESYWNWWGRRRYYSFPVLRLISMHVGYSKFRYPDITGVWNLDYAHIQKILKEPSKIRSLGQENHTNHCLSLMKYFNPVSWKWCDQNIVEYCRLVSLKYVRPTVVITKQSHYRKSNRVSERDMIWADVRGGKNIRT